MLSDPKRKTGRKQEGTHPKAGLEENIQTAAGRNAVFMLSTRSRDTLRVEAV